MKRRNFLGLLGGAAVAGPKLAQGMAANVASGAGVPPMGYAFASKGATGPDNDYRIRRISELKDLLTGKSSEVAKQRKMNRLYQVESEERFRLDSLRAVSPTHKMRMFIEGSLDRQERINKLHAEDELERLLKVPDLF